MSYAIMKKIFVIFLIAFTLLNFPALAMADWVWFGAATKCSSDIFLLESVIESSGGNITPSKGTRRLTEHDKTIRCTVAQSTIEATVQVTPPNDKGGCGVNGYVFIKALKVDGKDLLTQPGSMNDYCSISSDTNSMNFTRIEVISKGGSMSVHLCKGIWNWSNTFEQEKCEIIKIAPAPK